MSLLQNVPKCGTMYAVKNGFIVCPVCRKTMHGIRVTAATSATALELRCTGCKTDFTLDIDRGQCFDSQRP